MKEIVQDPHPTLREQAREIPIEKIGSPSIQKLIADMKEALAKEELGVALAAPQVGEQLRLFVVSGTVFAMQKAKEYDPEKHEAQTFINPAIVSNSKKTADMEEGCLSLRGKWGVVPRAERVTLSYFNERGEKKSRGASGLLAQIFQHEVDHLDGILYIDKATQIWTDAPKES